jgi:predicted ABC-type sugar transport system permease subunit
LGKFVGKGTYQVTGASPDGLKVYFHVAATWTAANGNKLYLDMPQWVNDNSVTPPTSTGAANIIGGTGRFVNASGALFGEITPAVITPGVPNGLTMEGTITY